MGRTYQSGIACQYQIGIENGVTENRLSNKSAATVFYEMRNKWEDILSERDDLHPTTRLIGIWIARRISHNSKGRATWYPMSVIAERIGVNERTVIRAVAALEEAGLIIVRRDGRRGVKQAVNRYELVFSDL
jgi:DNA-binding MarR family transcriptional regulator